MGQLVTSVVNRQTGRVTIPLDLLRIGVFLGLAALPIGVAEEARGGPGPSAQSLGSERPDRRIVPLRTRSRGQEGPRGAAPGRQEFSPEQVRRTIYEDLLRKLNGRASEIHVRLVEPARPVLLPRGAATARVTSRGPEGGLGQRQFTLALSVDGRPVQTITVVAEVEALADAVVPTRVLRRDEVLQEEDVALTQVRLTGGQEDLVWKLEDAVGKRVTRPLMPEQPLKASSLALPYVVRKGDRVAIEARRAGFTIRAVGQSKSHGVVGQSITVTNLDTGKQLQATVVAPGIVQVEF